MLRQLPGKATRRCQFDALDMDGNAMVSKGELSYFMGVARDTSMDNLDDVFSGMDTAGTGGADLKAFIAWI